MYMGLAAPYQFSDRRVDPLGQVFYTPVRGQLVVPDGTAVLAPVGPVLTALRAYYRCGDVVVSLWANSHAA